MPPEDKPLPATGTSGLERNSFSDGHYLLFNSARFPNSNLSPKAPMAGCYVEERRVPKTSTLSWDLTHHLFTRQLRGIILVLAKNPHGLLPAITKQWYKVIRQAERERSSTLSVDRVMEFTHQINNMQRLRFLVDPLELSDEDDVLFVSPTELHQIPATCHTVYLTSKLSEKDFATLLEKMPPHSLLVRYMT